MPIKTKYVDRFFGWLTGKRHIENLILNEGSFPRWVEGRSGNVYDLFKKYLIENSYGAGEIEVFPDAVAFEPKHEFFTEGRVAWKNWDKHPKWFRGWVRDNAVGKYKTEYRGGQKK